MVAVNAATMAEPEYRALVKAVYDRVARAFDKVDPDRAECEDALGTLTITLADGSRWILSTQPPVRQLWLAVASIGRAYHFSYHPETGQWLDDKGEGLELVSHLQGLLRRHAGVSLDL
ncbi:MAG: iron donor protein CyaY [Candidatus Lambdaproteobacteria bacterium]|nr:iron donor protein CyaY [Candidatus Lambdaproteobacteria bacterium]